MDRRTATRFALLAAFTVFVVGFIAREMRDRTNRNRAYPVVKQLGGQIGSIPLWPMGDEIRISFHDRDFTRDELRRLAVLNPLTARHFVGVAFVDTNLTDDDVTYLHDVTPNCLLLRYADGELVQRVSRKTH